MKNYTYRQFHDNIVQTITPKKALFFPLRLFDKEPASEGGNSRLESKDGSLYIETSDFDQVHIYVSATSKRDPEKIKKALLQFLNEVE
jgi:hypothetical protein